MGASVRGPAHAQQGLPNQDAWLYRIGRRAALAVVCDGLGSREHAAFGSRAACRSVADATRQWLAIPGAPVEHLLRLVHALWNMRVHALSRDACATTCLFALVDRDTRIVLAQLGDGLAILKTSHGEAILEADGERFSNTTTGLGIATDLRAWRVHVATDVTAPTSILLATDGIADDLVADRRFAFADHLIDCYGALPAASRSRAIAASLRAWPAPLHADDKTVAALWKYNE
ncbi:hypothetical protein WM26_16120 [Burkholderia cepacia]|nr:hypothetical protein WM26_16120 [Burkholderia cepacia]